MGLETPVLVCSFNRPDLTRRIIDQLRCVKPKALVFSVDGPRPGRADDREKVAEVRSIVHEIDWDCHVTTNFSDVNLGCMKGPVSAMNRAFAEHERAIILEDDCYPDLTFFRYCEELLERYADDRRIGMITGSRQLPTETHGSSYGFSRYAFIWGWASWRRTWELFDVRAAAWPEIEAQGILESAIPLEGSREFFRKRIQKVYSGEESSVWDYQFNLAMWAHHLLCVVPESNLIQNVGQFRPDATHNQTFDTSSTSPLVPMSFPLRHPQFLVPDVAADRWVSKKIFTDHAIVVRVMRKARSIAAGMAGL